MSANSARRFDGKVAIVTGGASGIGEATMRRLVAEGAHVVVGDINTERLATLEGEVDSIATLECDVTKPDEIEALVALAVDRFGRLDVAFNIAGATRVAPIMELADEDWYWTVDLCLNSVFMCMKQEARQMVRQGDGGAIVNVSSLNSEVPMFYNAPYCAAKAGVVMLGECGALEFAEHGIRVNTVSPGLTKTNFTVNGQSTAGMIRDDLMEAYMERIPLGVRARPDQLASACCFLASEDASYVTGINMLVDGGWATSGYPDTRRFLSTSK